ncbi:hypothetical protein EGI24_14035 [Lacihabitans sp. CS3-21]|nr:hypothetical protein [Lacihabitans sp. CS3-21]
MWNKYYIEFFKFQILLIYILLFLFNERFLLKSNLKPERRIITAFFHDFSFTNLHPKFMSEVPVILYTLNAKKITI